MVYYAAAIIVISVLDVNQCAVPKQEVSRRVHFQWQPSFLKRRFRINERFFCQQPYLFLYDENQIY